MPHKKAWQNYLKIAGVLMAPLFLAYLLSLWLSFGEEEKIAPKVQSAEKVDAKNKKSEQELEAEIDQILKKHNISLDMPTEELFDEVFERWTSSEQDAKALDKIAKELSAAIEKSPYKDQLQIPLIEESLTAEAELTQLKAANNHPLDISLEYCVEQNLQAIGKCVLSHIQLWEKDLKNSYDLIVAKTKGKTQKDFIAAQASWQQHLVAENQLAESMLPSKGEIEKINAAKIKLLFQVLQRIKERALELQDMHENLVVAKK